MRDLLLKHRVAAGASWTGQHALYGGTSTPAIYLSPSLLRVLPRLPFPLSLFFSRLPRLPGSSVVVVDDDLPRPVNLDPGSAALGEGRERRQKKGAKGEKKRRSGEKTVEISRRHHSLPAASFIRIAILLMTA